MRFIADFHIHSPYSRATSRLLTLENIASWAAKKGITVIGTGDFTHPKWLAEICEKLEESEDGLYRLKERTNPSNVIEPRFVISGEISCIYKKHGRLRKVHNLILLPDIGSAKRLNNKLSRIGNLEADGRPILGLDSKRLLEIVLEVSPDAFFIPAHIWTPWFSLFGSRSGFDSIEECFEDLTDHIYALETGLSSDPPMNRLLSSLDNYVLISNSDAHSPAKLGREANIFDTALNYRDMIQAMKDGNGFLGTIEFFPEEGKYHLDGHRKCNVCLDPLESISLKNICPVCGKPLTIGVLHRVYELADRKKPLLKKDFYSLIPLNEILSETMGYGSGTKKVKNAYERLILELGSEMSILMDLPLADIEKAGGELLAEAIKRMRMLKVIKRPGYDGEYGKIRLFKEGEKALFSAQSFLFKIPLEDKERQRQAQGYKRNEGLLNDIDKRKEEVNTGDVCCKDNPDPLYGLLNHEQRKAVLHDRAHLIIVAGPGSGKTLTLTHRIAHFIHSGIARPDQVLAITFTRKAAEEMDFRIKQLLSLLHVSSEGIWISTFHSFCLWLLREEGEYIGLTKDFSVCPEWETREIIAQICKKKRLVSKFLKILPFLKRGSLEDKAIGPELLDLFRDYEKRLSMLNMLDMDDLETKALRLLKDFPEIADKVAGMRPYIFVDEYQDTNPNQVGILKAIAASGRCYVCAIGDPDQAIYGFRGSDRNGFLRFCNDFDGATQVVLNKNYRSAQVILQASASIIDKPPMKGGVKDRGHIIINPCSTAAEEAESIVESIERFMGGISYFSLDSKRVETYEGDTLSFGDIAVLYRINSLGDEMEHALKRAGIPYIRSGEIPLREIYPVNIIYHFLLSLIYKEGYYRDRYWALVSRHGIDPVKEVSIEHPLFEIIERAIELHNFDPLNETSIKAIGKIKEMAKEHKGDLSSFLDIISLERGIDNLEIIGDRVSLMSLHSAKGLEWKVVFIIGCEDGIIPCTMFGDADTEEEKRLFYVGMTRAKEVLILSYARKRPINKRTIYANPSPFLDKIPEHLIRKHERRRIKTKKEPIQLSLF